MNTISRAARQSGVLTGLMLVLLFFLAACDFHGPWEYYPDERDVYTGIYTYGYILDGGESRICFSKVYELDETSAEGFAFYDSAYVTVTGRFNSTIDSTTIKLEPIVDNPNCFAKDDMHYYGLTGETYTMEAFFKWDSAGHTAKSTYRAQATVPAPVKVKGLSVPQQDGSFEWVESDGSDTVHIKFLEFPLDMETVKCALDYDKSIKGVISILQYGMENEESMNTTVNKMVSGLVEPDSEGYTGIAMHDPLEHVANLGYTTKQSIAGIQALDTLFLPNMMMPLGSVTVVFYTTDEHYIDYESKVKGSVSDSRVVPESNIENGMGVFSGMAKSTFSFYVEGEDGVSMEHIAAADCEVTSEGKSKSWASRGCRLYQDTYCSGMPVEDVEFYGLRDANSQAAASYELYEYRTEKACYPSLVKAAMWNEKEKWSAYLPDTISKKDKDKAYADGLKRYCVASNFRSNSIADCSELEEQCLESPEKNNCKEYLWNWCADRGWKGLEIDNNVCHIGLVSRYYLEKQKSEILRREVQEICDWGRFPICDNWCKEKNGHMVCD